MIVTDAADNALDVQFPKLREGRKYKVAVSDYIYRNYKLSFIHISSSNDMRTEPSVG